MTNIPLKIYYIALFFCNLVSYRVFVVLGFFIKFNNKKPQKVLIIPQRFLGDVVITSQVFENLIALNPEVKITILQYKSKICEILYGDKLGQNLDKIISYTTLLDTIKQIRACGHFDLLIRFSSSSARRSIVLLLAKCFRRYTIVREKKIIKKTLPDGNKIKQNIANENYLLFCNKKLNGILQTNFEPKFFLPLNEVKYKSTLPQNTIIICAGASFLAKAYSMQNFDKLSRHLSSLGYHIALLGGTLPHEQHLPQHIYHNTLIAPVGDINETLAKIKSAKLFISNDSGFAHVGAALGTPTLVIAAFMSMQMYGYSFLPNFYCIHSALPCFPCNVPSVNKNCPYYKNQNKPRVRCVDEISLAEVILKCETILLR